MTWLQVKEIIILKCHFLLFYTTTMNHFSIGLWCAMKSGFYMTTGDDQLSSWTEKRLQSISQSQTCTTKRSWSLYSLQLSESWWNHYIWEVCSANWWDAPKTAMPAASICSVERTQVFSTTMPDCISHEQCFKSWMNWATEFCLIHHIHLTSCQLTTTSSAGKMLPQQAGGRKCFPRVRWILKHRLLCYKN